MVLFQKRFGFDVEGEASSGDNQDFSASGFQNKCIFRHQLQYAAKMIFFRGVEAAFTNDFATFHLPFIQFVWDAFT